MVNVFVIFFAEFDQDVYTKDFPFKASFDSMGFVYVPKACYKVQCKLLVFFHGCVGGFEVVGPKVILEAGFPQALESRGIVGLFPQIKGCS